MPVTTHKGEITKHAVLSIGQLAEEAQERYKTSRTRKTLRENTNEDLLNLLLVSSDSLITSLCKLSPKKRQSFAPAVIALLAPPLWENYTLKCLHRKLPSQNPTPRARVMINHSFILCE